ncbi:MAG: N5,N10-methylene tetrahydromethanopterin reductase, partial [Microbacterium sp.]
GAADVVVYAAASFGPGAQDRVRAAAGGRRVDGDRALWGSAEQVAAGVRRIAESGVDAVVLLPGDEPDLVAFYRCAGAVARLVAGAHA